ncbi:response regulator transcription factor [Paenibacillus sp. YN15]|uniref:response regulator transcription factor n=1 Tax=Paenibacillus sp. YN15 TaxID=1742774 RepID=UPI000DCBA8FF|nr:response regulator transcription factor [Paenibacillus sp. YN15]RAU99859.1 DNA-binding response regulator [Paenibacillus sp. YN15]
MKRILLIEDERNLSRFVELELRHEGFEVSAAFDGETGLRLAETEEWNLILLDLKLPGLDGVEVCRRIRAFRRTPIIMLTVRGSVADRVAGLDCGADDYLTKPFAIEELLARIRVIFRRQDEAAQAQGELLTVRELALHVTARTVHRGGQLLDLTRREFDLLAALMKNANCVMTREALLDLVWGFEAVVDTNVVDVYIRYLRNKIDRPGEAGYIQTQRGIGYVMRK